MASFVLQRILQGIVIMIVMSVIVFAGVYAIGNPMDVLIPPEATQDVRERTIARFGLDRPLWEQYFYYMRNLFQGDLGQSYIFNEPVLKLIASRMPATLELVLTAVLGATLIGIPLGIYAGYRPGKPVFTHRHGGFHPGLFGADFLGRPDPHLDLCRVARLAAIRRARRYGGDLRYRLEHLHARRLVSPDPAGHQSGAVQTGHHDPIGRAPEPARSCWVTR